MRLFKALLIALVLVGPARAGELPSTVAVRSMEAAMLLYRYVGGIAASGGLPDYTRPPAADWFRMAFDVDALATLPPPQVGDVTLMQTWGYAADQTTKAILRNGAKPAVNVDDATIARNVERFEDQYAVAADFTIRVKAREATAYALFLDSLGAEQSAPIRAGHTARARSTAAEMIERLLAPFVAPVGNGVKPATARRVTAALRDTRAVWAAFIAPDVRWPIHDLAEQAMHGTTDEEARRNLASFSAALVAAK
ncbi:MAG TPA: hypothetical protein VKX28_06325 [Xanthobacteraceae bacterium]|nr:hypothetical protein [Xanthobacteraceae bacterium]